MEIQEIAEFYAYCGKKAKGKNFTKKGGNVA